MKMKLCPALVSCIFVFLTQFSFTLIPLHLSSFSLSTHLSLSALLLLLVSTLGSWFRRLIGFYASAPSFVFFSILFVWGVQIVVIREEISSVWSGVFGVECVLLVWGFCRILSSDPGLVVHGDGRFMELNGNDVSGVNSFTEEQGLQEMESGPERHDVNTEENSLLTKRIRYCKYCKAYIKGLDHHCPAFGNCIGEKNHVLFMALLLGFVMVETSYILCSSQFITKPVNMDKAAGESNLPGYLVVSTRLFSILQVMWQVPFLAWHIYCVFVNIRTDEWINWKKYPEFQYDIHLQAGQLDVVPRFRNPYNKGVVGNIKEFLSPKE